MSELGMEDSQQHEQGMSIDEEVPKNNLVDGEVAENPCNKEQEELNPMGSGAENKNVPEEEAGPKGVVNSPVEKYVATVTAEGDTTVTPNSLAKCSNGNAGDGSRDSSKNWVVDSMTEEEENGTLEEQVAFMKELEDFYREKSLDFRPPKFYQHPLNCLKLWRSVTRLGGYDRVTGAKLWRQIGEAFHPPKTCTTVSWTFRIFYEKSLLEYERSKCRSGDLQFAMVPPPEPSSVENEATGQAIGSGRARRDAAARAMQGWHVQRLLGYGEVSEPIVKEKNSNSGQKREKSLKSIGSAKNKRPAEVEHAVKAARIDTSKQLVTTVVDIGPPADWVKINVLESKECFEVYALIPGLLREEVRVQSDPAGRVVITGQPDQPQNPWGITTFKKVVNLPGRIDPLQTTAVVSLHGRLFVRVPFEQPNGV